MKKLKILDLFSGIGTFSYAFDNVEVEGQKVFETVAFCEIDKDCHRVLRKHFPEVTIFEDVSKLKYQDKKLLFTPMSLSSTKCVEGEIDIIVGGFPCTDISVAGKQKGLIDEELYRRLITEGKTEEEAREGAKTRSGLWTHYKRLIKEIKPKYVIIENVRNLLSNGFETVLKDLSEIGYDAEWEVISARDVGQCHLRERLWIIAYPNRLSIRNKSERPEIGWDDLQTSWEGESRDLSTTGETSSNTDDDRRLQGLSILSEQQGEGLQFGRSCEDGTTISPDSDYFRFWPTFTSEEEKRQWWAEATFKFRDWRQTQPELRGVYDGPTTGLYEKFRRARIRQLGNGIVRSIAELHAERIAYHEFNAEAAL